jgi:hypothetical protein
VNNLIIVKRYIDQMNKKMLNLCNDFALGLMIGLVYCFVLSWFGFQGCDTTKQKKLFIGVIISNIIFVLIFNSMGLVGGFSLAYVLLSSKM